jgi:hypothetical protein
MHVRVAGAVYGIAAVAWLVSACGSESPSMLPPMADAGDSGVIQPPPDGGTPPPPRRDAGPPVDNPPCTGAVRWTDISSAQIQALGGASAQSYPGGVSGVVINRLTGDVSMHIVGFGIWRSSDRGGSWTRIDQNTIDASGGRSETGWSIQVDQDTPTRMAVFTLDGTAGYTADGTTWHRWAESGWGRNWDFGAVDWSSPQGLTIFGVLHETSPTNQFVVSTDGGAHWSQTNSGHVAPTVGVVDARTFLASRGAGIERSTDLGATWTRVSSVTPLSHVVTRFRNRFYVTTLDGLLVSADGGQSWRAQGVGIPGQRMYQGPYFGADENTIVIGTHPSDNLWASGSRIYKSTDGGESWQRIVDAPAGMGFPVSFAWFGSFAWDPVHDTYYVSAMSNPAYRLDCAP